MDKTEKKLLSIAATAEALSLSKTTIRDLIRRGIFKPNRATRRVLVPVAQVEEFATGRQLARVGDGRGQ